MGVLKEHRTMEKGTLLSVPDHLSLWLCLSWLDLPPDIPTIGPVTTGQL